jgi:hypothetical protein
MSELSTSAFFRLRRTVATRLRETMVDNLQDTIDDLEGKRQDAVAQDLINQIIILAQAHSLGAADRLQDVCDFVLSLTDENEEENGVVDLAPKMDQKPER